MPPLFRQPPVQAPPEIGAQADCGGIPCATRSASRWQGRHWLISGLAQ